MFDRIRILIRLRSGSDVLAALTIRESDGSDRVVQVNGDIAAESRSVYLHRGEDVNGGDANVEGWSPDGKSVVVIRDQYLAKKTNIAIISIADGAVSMLKDNLSLGSAGGASFSPDGRYVAYHRREDGVNASDIFVLTLDGQETRVVEGPGEDRDPQ